MENLIETIKKKIEIHHSLYDIPVADLMWEEILYKSLKDSDMAGDAEWQSGGHGIGADIMNVPNFGDISCKTGAWKERTRIGDTVLVINGSRTTKYPSIEEKIEFLSKKKEDVYFCLARNLKDWKQNKKIYRLCIFPRLRHHEMKWKIAPNGRDWVAENSEMKCKITKNMSDQLWTELQTKYIESCHVIEI